MANIDTSKKAVKKLLGGVTDGPLVEKFGNVYSADGKLIAAIDDNYVPDARFFAWCREGVPALSRDLEVMRAERDQWRNTATNKLELMDSTALRAKDAEIATLRARVAELSALLGRAVNGPWLGSDLDSARAALSREGGE